MRLQSALTEVRPLSDVTRLYFISRGDAFSVKYLLVELVVRSPPSIPIEAKLNLNTATCTPLLSQATAALGAASCPGYTAVL